MKDEGWFHAVWWVLITDGWMDRESDIGDCRVAFTTEKVKGSRIELCLLIIIPKISSLKNLVLLSKCQAFVFKQNLPLGAN